MLTKNQEIIYRRNGKEISKLDENNMRKLYLGLYGYVRFLQPFTKPDDLLTIPLFEGEELKEQLRTTRVRYVRRLGNTLVIETKNSTYEIEYKDIDLEKVLEDGEFNGVNNSKTGYVFPSLSDNTSIK